MLLYKGKKIRTVCIVMYDRDSCLMINDYGKLSFPGGCVESYDKTIYDTALREFREEVILQDCRGGFEDNNRKLEIKIPSEMVKNIYSSRKIMFCDTYNPLTIMYLFMPITAELKRILLGWNMIEVNISDLEAFRYNRNYQIHSLRIRNRERIALDEILYALGIKKIVRKKYRPCAKQGLQTPLTRQTKKVQILT